MALFWVFFEFFFSFYSYFGHSILFIDTRISNILSWNYFKFLWMLESRDFHYQLWIDFFSILLFQTILLQKKNNLKKYCFYNSTWLAALPAILTLYRLKLKIWSLKVNLEKSIDIQLYWIQSNTRIVMKYATLNSFTETPEGVLLPPRCWVVHHSPPFVGFNYQNLDLCE